MIIVDRVIYPQALLDYAYPKEVRLRMAAGTATPADLDTPKIPFRWWVDGFTRGSWTTFELDRVSHWLKLELPKDLQK